MRCISILLVVALTIFFAPGSARTAPIQKSVVPIFVGEPTFNTTHEGNFTAGKIFAVELKSGKNVLITPLHLLGPAGGMTRQLTAAESKRLVRGVDIRGLDGFTRLGRGSLQLINSGDLSKIESQDLRGDLIAFVPSRDCKLTPIKISSKLPLIGARVKIVSNRKGGKGNLGGETFDAVVEEASNKFIRVRSQKKVALASASGSPVLSENGLLVGMIYGTNNDGDFFLNPGASIFIRLNTEIGNVPSPSL